jgi:hypothetical protein
MNMRLTRIKICRKFNPMGWQLKYEQAKLAYERKFGPIKPKNLRPPEGLAYLDGLVQRHVVPRMTRKLPE